MDRALGVAVASNGDIIVAGYTDSFGAGNDDAWVLRLPPDGQISQACIEDPGFSSQDSDAEINITDVTPDSSATAKVKDTTVSGKVLLSATSQSTNAVVETQYYYGPILLSFVSPTPENNSVVSTDYVFINVTSDNPMKDARLEWNGQNVTMEKASNVNWYLNLTNLTNGHYTFRVWGKNCAGDWFSSEIRSVTVNRTIHLTFTSPTPENGSVVSTDYVFVNVTSDQPLESALLEWDGENITMHKISSKNWYLNVTNVTNGYHTFRVWGNDPLGNWFNTEARIVIVNSTVVLSFVPPTPSNGEVVTVDSVVINVTSSQPLESAVVEWNGKNFTMHRESGESWHLTLTGLSNGHYTFRVWGNDSLGNWFSTEVRSVTINVNTQSTYDIWIKLSCLWTTWFFNHRTEFFELYENATVLGVDNETLQLALELNDNATALMLSAWEADNLENIRANLWNFKSPTRLIPRLWNIRKAFLMEKGAVEILRKALEAS